MSTTAGPDEDRTRMPDAAAGAAPAQGTVTAPIAPTVSSTGTPRTFADEGEAEVLPVGTRLQEFEITGLVGIGGFGIVYTAHDHSLGRTVALKEYLPTSLAARGPGRTITIRSSRHRESFDAGLRSFVNEARLLARFDHPSLVKVFRFWEENGTAYMVMPYYAGETLKARLRGLDAPPSEAWLRQLATSLCAALDVLHKQSCFHRDIAPDNVILVEDDRPVLLDFGAARHVIGDLTQNLTVILKPGYAPIEQYGTAVDMRQGAWTDLYALAGMLRYAILGSPPVPAVNRILTDDMRPLADEARGRYSESFLTAIDTALAVRPEGRPRDVTAFLALFDKAPEASRAPVSAAAPPSPAPAIAPAPAPAPAAKRAPAPAPAAPTAPKPAANTSDAPHRSRVLPITVLGGLVVAAGVAAWWIADNLGGSPKAPPVVAKPAPPEPRESPATTPANAPAPATETASPVTTTVPPSPTTTPAASESAPPISPAPPPAPPPVVAAPSPAPAPASKPPPRTLPPREREVANAPRVPPPAPQSIPTAPQPVTTAPATQASAPSAPPAPPPDPKIAEAADLLARGRDSFARREYARAAELADRALALRPGDTQAQELRRQARAAEKAAFESIKIE